jgi:hypothetical protein
MKLAIGTLVMFLALVKCGRAQTEGSANLASTEASAASPETGAAESYAIFNATPAQEAALRAKIRLIYLSRRLDLCNFCANTKVWLENEGW